MSSFATKRTSRHARYLSAFGGKTRHEPAHVERSRFINTHPNIPPGPFNERPVTRGRSFAPHQARALSRNHVGDRCATGSSPGGSSVPVHPFIPHTPPS